MSLRRRRLKDPVVGIVFLLVGWRRVEALCGLFTVGFQDGVVLSDTVVIVLRLCSEPSSVLLSL